MTEENEETTSGARERSSVPWIVIGMVIGVGIGIALDNIATGIGIGAALGISLGLAFTGEAGGLSCHRRRSR